MTGTRRPPPRRPAPAPPPPDDPAPDPAARRTPRRATPAGYGKWPAAGRRQRAARPPAQPRALRSAARPALGSHWQWHNRARRSSGWRGSVGRHLVLPGLRLTPWAGTRADTRSGQNATSRQLLPPEQLHRGGVLRLGPEDPVQLAG